MVRSAFVVFTSSCFSWAVILLPFISISNWLTDMFKLSHKHFFVSCRSGVPLSFLLGLVLVGQLYYIASVHIHYQLAYMFKLRHKSLLSLSVYLTFPAVVATLKLFAGVTFL